MAREKRVKPMSVEELARITSGEFSELRKLNHQIVQILDGMQADLKYVKLSTRSLPTLEREVEDIAHRVSRLERRAGVR